MLRYKSHPANRAVVRLSVDGQTQGNDLNQLTSATFKSQDFGVVRFPAAGDHVVRLAVVGKTNVATTPWNMTADLFSLVPDSKKPVITTPLPDLTLEATGPSGAMATYAASATDIKDGAVEVVFTPPSGTVFPIGTTSVTATATDFHGNAATVTFEVTVEDTTAPAISVPGDITLEATGPAGAVATFSASADDVVSGSVAATLDPASGSTFALGTTTVTATAIDAAGNTATRTFTVTVVDTTPPALTLPAPITAEATGPDGAAVGFTATATDIVSGSLPVTFSAVPGSVFPLGVTTVTGSATDAAGNTSSGSFTVTVVDTTRPVLTVPANRTITSCETPDIGQATATDAVGPVSITNDAPSLFALGLTVVTWRAVDAWGNETIGTQRVTAELGDSASCCPVGTKVILGTSANNVLLGTQGADCILGLGGNDVINALGGNDFISGGAGNDTIVAGLGDDLVMGGAGDDVIDGTLGDDTIRGGAGRDTIAAGPGSDNVDGGPDYDVCAVPPDGVDVVASCP